ncbi:uncharacterized protein LOC130623139 [Hydractinia symbiolongicarpus]|uniref:uncharacterized protein LOC130623139 n=1 Tax=Hydractinia symbiolongicarpus TaxID=13093 RepID=UPI0025516B50|nr:uncharacterized protein LOC130623139 [Hydractinia symbiolongicarpus]
MGPLSRTWYAIEASLGASRENPEEIFWKDLSQSVEQTVLLLGQAFNAVSYHRRLNVLSAIMSDKKKVMLKDESPLLEIPTEDNLFGKKFQEHVIATAKTKKKSKEVYGLARKSSSSTSTTNNFKRPFRGEPSLDKKQWRYFKPAPRHNQQQSSNFKQTSFPRLGGEKSKFEGDLHQVDSIESSKPEISRNNSFKESATRSSLNNWEILTKDPEILEYVSGLQIPFIEQPKQQKIPQNFRMNQKEVALVTKEVESTLVKGAIQSICHVKGEFLSNVFLVPKKDRGNRPVSNLKHLNKFVPYHHFKMEGLHLIQEMIQEGDYMCKIDLKDAYFCVPLHQRSRKYVRFQWQGNLYEFLCMCFGLGPAPRIFTKLMKIPISILRKINVGVIIYLNDMLLLRQSKEKLFQARDTLIFLLQNLGFVINLPKSILEPVQTINFLGVEINSMNMRMNLPQEKVKRIEEKCKGVLTKPSMTVWELSSLVGKLSSTSPAVIPANLQIRHMQKCLTKALQLNKSYQAVVHLDPQALWEIHWWLDNLALAQGRSLLKSLQRVIIQTDASKQGWGAVCQGRNIGGAMVSARIQPSHQHLRIKSGLSSYANVLQNDAPRTYSLPNRQYDSASLYNENGGHQGPSLDSVIKRPVDFSIIQGDHNYSRTSTRDTECEGRLDVQKLCGLERMASRSSNIQDSMQKVGHTRRRPICITTFSSGTELHVLETRPRLLSGGCTATTVGEPLPVCISSVFLNGRVLAKVRREKVCMILITPAWQTQTWYGPLLEMLVTNPLLLPQSLSLLTNPQGKSHPLLENRTLRLVAWTISGKFWRLREYQEKLQSLSQVPEQRAHSLITNRPGESGLAGVVNNKLIPLNVL